MADLNTQIEACEREVLADAQKLSKVRKRAAKKLDKGIAAEAADMDLEDAVFQTRMEQRDARSDGISVADTQLGPLGFDDVEFLWSANAGQPPRPLARPRATSPPPRLR